MLFTFNPTVSGNKSARTPPITAAIPKMSIGVEPPSRPISKAQTDPARAAILQLPIAVFLNVVGKSSAA